MSSIVRRDFGSFHSSNVEELLNLTDDHFISLPIPFPLYDYINDGKIPFGRLINEKYFLLDNKYVFLNHGAFGYVLRQALEYSHLFQYYIEKQPLRFYDREVFPRLVDVIRKMAKYLGCTTAKVVVDLQLPPGKEEIASRYMSLGRVKSRKDAAILRDFPFSALQVKPSSAHRAELDRLDRLNELTLTKYRSWKQ